MSRAAHRARSVGAWFNPHGRRGGRWRHQTQEDAMTTDDGLAVRDTRDALTLRIPRVLRSANIGRGAHWSSRHRDTKAWETDIWVATLQTKGGRAWLLQTDRPERRRVTIVRHHPTRHGGRCDPDNLQFAGKGVRDALKRLGLIVDDNRQWLESAVEDAWTPGQPAHTTIAIERLAPAL